ncbi:acyl-phosphate glycerol 3-phosphate acyltransferase [Lysinibacillus tabacifolii]|uniref:Acyl-phosphate glycerol 3-phosphate acyltransferase n=2 Tax=Bacillaceae TaxID=186817 RepID=A0ABY2SXW9_9BACI|nr:acyl-phosphate glycerol 3-phosphate acyltransferase [Lysinibacillus tabacifolii]
MNIMFEAKKSKVAAWMFHLVQQRLLNRYFHKIWLAIEEPLPKNALFIANHSSWWDGLIFFQLEKRQKVPPIYMMTHEDGIKQVPIFKWIGAFSVNSQSTKHVVQSLRYAQKLLYEEKSVALFPQGGEVHLEARPLQFQKGAAFLAGKSPRIPVIPVTIYYTFRHMIKGEVWISIGGPIETEGRNSEILTQHFEEIMTAQLNSLKQDVVTNHYEKYINIL